MADHEDPIIISDDEDAEQRRRPRRNAQAYSVWYGSRTNRRNNQGRVSNQARERALWARNTLAYILALCQLVHPTYPEAAANREHFLLGEFHLVRVPTIPSMAQALANRLNNPHRVQMS
jgi:hypothetical protein